MLNKTVEIFGDSRLAERIKDNRRIAWQSKNGKQSGGGRIRNISTTGMMLETSAPIEFDDNNHFTFDADLGPKNYVPHKGRLVWVRRKGMVNKKSECGIEFQQPLDYVLPQLNEKIEAKTRKRQADQKLGVLASLILLMAMLSLMGFIIFFSADVYRSIKSVNADLLATSGQQAALTQSYAYRLEAVKLHMFSLMGELDTTKQLYSNTQNQLDGVTADLLEARQILQQTESMLTQARSQNSDLSNELASLRGLNEQLVTENQAKLSDEVVKLTEENVSLNMEMKNLQDHFAMHSDNVENSAEGAELIAVYKQRIRDLKKRMREFKKEAHAVKKAAQTEQDRVRSLLGNNGYLVKDGKPVVVDEKSYAQGTLPTSTLESDVSSNSKVDVTFVD